MKKVLIAGSTGMVGELLLNLCLENQEIEQVISLVRRPSGKNHIKLTEVAVSDFSNYNEINDHLENIDIVFFCIGVYTGSVARDKFYEITVDYPVALAKLVQKRNDNFSFCLLSGAGADRSEKSKMMFAKDKGIAENKLEKMKLGEFYALRPAYIYPVHPRKEPNFSYRLLRFLYKPLFSKMGDNASIKSTELAEAMLKVGLNGYTSGILENKDLIKIVNS